MSSLMSNLHLYVAVIEVRGHTIIVESRNRFQGINSASLWQPLGYLKVKKYRLWSINPQNTGTGT
jgi:hypothetical protein